MGPFQLCRDAEMHIYHDLFVTTFRFFSQGTPAGLVRYKVDPEAYPYSASIFDVDDKTGNVVTRVNLNEEPNLKFNVRNYIFIRILYTMCVCLHAGVCSMMSWGPVRVDSYS